eukprot:scaffold16872_cov17-Tisochrysis_lutea.AAC.1
MQLFDSIKQNFGAGEGISSTSSNSYAAVDKMDYYMPEKCQGNKHILTPHNSVLVKAWQLFVSARHQALQSPLARTNVRDAKKGMPYRTAYDIGGWMTARHICVQDKDEVLLYFDYIGLLATEGSYDMMNELLEIHSPGNVILLLAARENDAPK